eukprot:5939446-Prorocentrum_lima.AAC.1
MRHTSTGRLWNQPTFGEVVAMTRPGPKKALEPRGHVCHYPYAQTWTTKATYVLVTDRAGRNMVKHGLELVLLDHQ